jgi:alcohol dehydrogenase (cytochrome c)
MRIDIMINARFLLYFVAAIGLVFCNPLQAQRAVGPVTDAMLLDPDPADWLMFSRTYDNQRFSPLSQINRSNVKGLQMVWSRGLQAGLQEFTPLVHQGVMYLAQPDAKVEAGTVQAVDATNGDLIWEYRRVFAPDVSDYVRVRTRNLAIYQDMLFYAAPDGYLIALATSDGTLRWETVDHDYRTGTEQTSGPFMAGGKVVTGRNCDDGPDVRETCFIAAHDAETGELAWRFNVAAGAEEAGGDTWGGKADGSRACAPWGIAGGYDPARNVVYWGVANPTPHTRYRRHDGNPFAVPLTAPSELYCNSTLALNADTGELVWYYQHLPADDWDSDWTHERVRFESVFDPDPAAVRWINPNIPRGEKREMVATVGEPGGLWVLDQETGEFLWAISFPFDTPLFHIADVDVNTGMTKIRRDTVLTADKQEHTLCFQNTKGYWPMAYHPGENALYIPYHDACFKRIGDLRPSNSNGHIREIMPRPGGDPEALTGIAKVNMETGRIERFHEQRNPTNGAVLATAADLIFWGDMNRRFRAFDAKSGDILWETVLGGIVQSSTITYAVDDRQYIAVLTGDGAAHTSGKLQLAAELKTVRGHNAVYVFALPK